MKQQKSVKDRILDSANTLFYSEGIQAVGIDKIIKEANVALNTFYKYFKSKNDLIMCYLDYRDNIWLQRLKPHIENKNTKIEVFDGIFLGLNEWFNEPDYNGCAFVNATGEFGLNNREIFNKSNEHKKHVYEMILGSLNNIDTSEDNEKLALKAILLIEGSISISHILNISNLDLIAKDMYSTFKF